LASGTFYVVQISLERGSIGALTAAFFGDPRAYTDTPLSSFADCNRRYDSVVDDSIRGKERIIFPKKGEARWWAEFFGRTDEEMNSFGPQTLSPQVSNTHTRTPSNGISRSTTPLSQEPIVTGTETAEGATGAGTTASSMPPTHAIPNSISVSDKTHDSVASPFDAAAALSRDIGHNLKAGIANLGIGPSRGVGPAGEASDELRKKVEVEMQ
jgi:myotubularin-related protein 6/7/8